MKLTKTQLKQLIQECITTSLFEGMCGPEESGQWRDKKMVCAKKCAPKGSANLMGLPECPPKKTKKAKEKETSLTKSKNKKPLVIPKPKEEAKPKPKKRTKKNPNSRKSKIKCKYTDKVHGRCKNKKQNFGSKNESRLQLEFEAPSNESGLLKQLEAIVNSWPSETPEGQEYEKQIIDLIKQKDSTFEKVPTIEPEGIDYS